MVKKSIYDYIYILSILRIRFRSLVRSESIFFNYGSLKPGTGSKINAEICARCILQLFLSKDFSENIFLNRSSKFGTEIRSGHYIRIPF